jgi:hypothetical protein
MRRSHLIILPLALLLATLKSALGCSLCLDGSTITKPDYVIGLMGIIPLNTCKDLSDVLVFIGDDSDRCINARGVSALCGCPVADNACSICKGSQNITRPQQLLDGLVDFENEPYTFGLALTCALVESGMQVYDTGHEECLKIPFDGLRRYCGCPSEDEDESNECTLCPGGEIVPDQSGVDAFINIGDEDLDSFISCKDVKTLVAQTEKGTDACNEIQSVSTLCGCPIPENACRLCKNGGYMTEKAINVTNPSGQHISCQSFEAQLHNFKSSSIECTSLDESYSDQCGCLEAEAFVPCSLCAGGEETPFPEKKIKGIDGFGFDYFEHTCGTISKVIVSVHKNSEKCRLASVFAQLCGCKPHVENACTICGGGDVMSNPFQEAIFNFGTSNSIYPEDFPDGLYLSSDAKVTCEVADSAMASLLTQDESWCYWNQLVRGKLCGCPDNSAIVALVWTQRCSGILSLSGSLLISMSILTKPRKIRWSPYNQIVLGISFFDSLSSVAYIIGTAFGPKNIGLHGSIGNDATCGFQAWLFQIGLASIYYSVLLCGYFLLVVKYNWSERKFNKVAKWVHLGVGAVGLVMACAVIPFASPDWRWCYLGTPPQAASWLPGLFFFIIPVALCILAMTVITVIFVRYVQQAYRRTQSTSMRGIGRGQKRRSLANRTYWQSVWFLAIFYAVWPIQFAAFVVPTVPSNYWIYLLAAIFGPLQGFLNASIVLCRDRKSIQRWVSETTKKLLSLCIRKSTNTGSSVVVSAELEGDFETNWRETSRPNSRLRVRSIARKVTN